MENLDHKIQDCFWEMLDHKSLGEISMEDIARALDVPLGNVFDLYPSTSGLLIAFRQKIDHKMTAEAKESFDGEDLSEEEKLLELFMIRYDALADYKDRVRRLVKNVQPGDVCALMMQLPALKKTINLMLKLSGQKSFGLKHLARQKGLMYIYVRSLWIWLDDDSSDLSKTMSFIDRELEKGKALLNRFDLAA